MNGFFYPADQVSWFGSLMITLSAMKVYGLDLFILKDQPMRSSIAWSTRLPPL